MRFHLLRHGGAAEGDALDVLERETGILRELLDEWSATRPGGDDPTAVSVKWDHGTVGKLLLERAAVSLAAGEDVVRALEGVGHTEAAVGLGSRMDALRSVLDEMDRHSRGVQPMSLALSPAFDEAVQRLQELVRSMPADPDDVDRVDHLLGRRRQALHEVAYLRRHAPTHPGPKAHSALVTRWQTVYDRLRGIPWAESPLAHEKVTKHYDQEDPAATER